MPSPTRQVGVQIPNLKQYIELLNGLFKLTPKEIEVMAHFLERHLSILRDNVRIPTFSTHVRKKVAKRLSMTNNPNIINNYVKKLSDKGAIKKKVMGDYTIHPLLVPQVDQSLNLITQEVTFKINA